MLLIIQIILTVIAWTKAKWKWLSLIPLAVAVSAGFIYGAAGGDPTSPVVIVFDFLAAAALLIMCFVKNPKYVDKIEPPSNESSN